jgi:acetyl esterase/lipase
MGKKTDNADLAGFLAQQGLGAVLIDFRNAEGDGFYDQVTDVKDAIRWVHAHAAEYGLDPDRVGLFGSSSGGHLAGLAAFADGSDFGADPPGTSSAVQACFLLYGVYDLAALAETGQLASVVEWYAGADVVDHPEVYDFYSPVDHIDGSEPPTLVMHGKEDRLVPIEQAEELVTRLEDAGVPAQFMPVDALGHGFARKQRWTRPWLAGVMADFFRDAMK